MWKVGDRVEAKVSKWKGTIIKVIPKNSSPYKVRWDENGFTGLHNSMGIRRIEHERTGTEKD